MLQVNTLKEETPVDLLRGLFSYKSIYWVSVTIRDVDYRFKFTPLSLLDQLNISNKYSNIDDIKVRQECIVKDSCLLMLQKAGNNTSTIETLSSIHLLSIYQAMLVELQEFKESIQKFCDANKTIPLKRSTNPTTKLDSLVNITMVVKELNMSLDDVLLLDDVSLFCLLSGMNEIGVRESNSYEQSKSN